MSWRRRGYRPRNIDLARRGYRPLGHEQDLHPIHEAGGYRLASCPRCQAGPSAGESTQQEVPNHEQQR